MVGNIARLTMSVAVKLNTERSKFYGRIYSGKSILWCRWVRSGF